MSQKCRVGHYILDYILNSHNAADALSAGHWVRPLELGVNRKDAVLIDISSNAELVAGV